MDAPERQTDESSESSDDFESTKGCKQSPIALIVKELLHSESQREIGIGLESVLSGKPPEPYNVGLLLV